MIITFFFRILSQVFVDHVFCLIRHAFSLTPYVFYLDFLVKKKFRWSFMFKLRLQGVNMTNGSDNLRRHVFLLHENDEFVD